MNRASTRPRTVQAAQRLRIGAQALGLTWGTFALWAGVATAVFQGQDRATVQFETPLVIPVVLVMFAALAYCAWAVLSARAELRRQMPDAAVQR
jgi:H+/Cl- antiporter ClcA